jgi:ATP-dependent Clp protease ATP-binding subunit ClpA
VRPDIRVIGATTQAEYDRWVKGDPALERRFQPLVVRELTSEETLEILRARRTRLEHHHAVAIADEAIVAAQVLTDRFVLDRAQPDKAIDVLDEACAHAQATASLPPELEHAVRERRRVDAAIRRERGRTGAPGHRGTDGPDPLDVFAREVLPMLDRIGAEVEKIFGGQADARTRGQADERTDVPGHRGTGAPADVPVESLAERRDRLDRELRRGLEQLGIVVRGPDIARAVGAAVGKRIEWVG